MKKFIGVFTLLLSMTMGAWQTWIYNETGYDLNVKLYGIASLAGYGDFELTIPKDTKEKVVVDTGIYGIGKGTVALVPCEQTDSSCMECGHDEYCNAVLKFLTLNFENPCTNQLPGMTVRVTLVNVLEGNTRLDAWIKVYIEGYDGTKTIISSKKLTELLP